MRTIFRLGVLVVLASVLAGCSHLWAPPKPTLIFGPPVVEGDHGKIVVSVANMPRDGVGAIGVEFGGISYPAAKMGDFRVKGLNGFEVLAWDFHDGEGGFVAVSTTAMESGPIAVIEFEAEGAISPAEIGIDAAKISLASAHNTLIEGFEISRPAYYAR